MKLLHLGDLHLGKSLDNFDLIDDQEYILEQILNMAEEQKVDAILLAGDIYDKSIPSESAVNLLDSFLRKAANKNIKIFMISGNHDSDDRLNFGSSFFKEKEIYISSVFRGELYKKTISDEYGEVDIYLMPFVKASQVRHFFPEEEINNYEDAIKTILKHTDIDKDRRNIIVAHQFVTGNSEGQSASSKGKDKSSESERSSAETQEENSESESSSIETKEERSESESGSAEMQEDSSESILLSKKNASDPVPAGSEGISVRNVGTVEKIGYECFDAFDYVALGHIHSPQMIGREEIRYSGSILKYSKSEVTNEKSVPIISLNEKGKTEITLFPLVPKRNVRHIKGTLDTLLKQENIENPEDFIYVTLTNEEIINNAKAIIRQYYPNTLGVVYENSHTKEIENVDIQNITQDKSFQELIIEFYQQIYGCEISEEEMKVISEVAKEVGIIDETN